VRRAERSGFHVAVGATPLVHIRSKTRRALRGLRRLPYVVGGAQQAVSHMASFVGEPVVESPSMRQEFRLFVVCLLAGSCVSCGGVAKAKTSGSFSDAEGLKVECYGECTAWEVDDRALDVAEAVAQMAGAKWVSLPSGEEPQQDQLARCVSFNDAMTKTCGDFLLKAAAEGSFQQ